ncbi:Transposase (plasmid) [Nostoc flagelliforme CCNUN1]|uniref:Transposase n=1 Tax=Nostoc flagelliforme CCNUN1 TaxID=2038116 RepID=A0A2K8T7I3_9NOSO|nr:Transposase [Nostoc flagelliforme CCNUN1]
MNNLQSILSHINDTLQELPDCQHLEGFVSEFYSIWLKLGNFVQQSLLQSLIEQKEAEYDHPRTKREKRYYTPLGEMVLVRRAYVTRDGIKVKVDEELGLPKDKWLPLERYLTNNQSRIDYRSYLKAGLMIGSGVVESSNRRVVTQRLKQAGMHWSFFGAEGVMAIRFG